MKISKSGFKRELWFRMKVEACRALKAQIEPIVERAQELSEERFEPDMSYRRVEGLARLCLEDAKAEFPKPYVDMDIVLALAKVQATEIVEGEVR